MKRLWLDLRTLPAQMIPSFIGLVLLMAVAAVLPAVWLTHRQLERQAWAQVQRGERATQALYTAIQEELAGLATLTAQRPTLHRLLLQGDGEALPAYLHTLRQGLGLDLVLLCKSGQAVAQAGEAGPTGLCAGQEWTTSYVVAAGSPPQVWLVSAHSLEEPAVSPWQVVVGRLLDDDLAVQMRAQTGLEHTVLVAGQPMATSLPARRSLAALVAQEGSQSRFTLNGHPYYATRFSLDAPDLQAEVALDISDIVGTQRRLGWVLVGSIVAVTVIASLLGTFLARRIGGPLARLADAAAAMSRGDLEGPLGVEAGVREVALVAQALEGARSDLKRSLVELRQEKAWTDHLLEAIVEGIVTLDRHGRITFFSHGAERITGWNRDEVIGHSCDRIFQPIESEEPFSQLIPPPGQRRKIPVELRDGRQAILAFTGARLLPPEGGDARVALVFRDVSEEEAVHRLLGHFLANVAHEFRTPLSALAASVELLLDQAPDLSPGELGELLTSLHLGVLGLQTLIDNLLESANIETGHFHVRPRPSSLGDMIAEAIAMMQPLLDKHGQRLVVELPAAIPVVHADPRRTVQVLVNLLSNASKYGPDDAVIDVRATVEKEWVRVAVADSGPGVPFEQRKNLFRRFVHPRSGGNSAQVGIGLGLSVVKAIIEAHGGEVGIDDRPGGGATFWFTLPLVSS